MLMQVRALPVRDRVIDVAVDMDVLRTIAMSMPMKMHAVAPQAASRKPQFGRDGSGRFPRLQRCTLMS